MTILVDASLGALLSEREALETVIPEDIDGVPNEITYYSNNTIKEEIWGPGKRPDNLWYHIYHKNGEIKLEVYHAEGNKNGLLKRSWFGSGRLQEEQWLPGKSPNGVQYQKYDKFGKLLEVQWDKTKGPGDLLYIAYFSNKNLKHEQWEPAVDQTV